MKKWLILIWILFTLLCTPTHAQPPLFNPDNPENTDKYGPPSKRPFPRNLVSSRFGERDIEKGGVIVHEFHSGVDYRATTGTPVTAAGNGVIVLARAEKGYGFYYIIDHGIVSGNEVLSVYAHLSEPKVLSGSTVKAGEVIGLVGDSGNAEGPHLHFEVRIRKAGTKRNFIPI